MPGPRGDGNLSGTWPRVWYRTLDGPASKTFVAYFIKKCGKPPENRTWIEYISLKIMAQAIGETKSTETDKLIAYLEKETEFDILKAGKGHFRNWDHQLMQEAYPFTVKPKGRQGPMEFHRARGPPCLTPTPPWNRLRQRASKTPAPCNRDASPPGRPERSLSSCWNRW